MITSSKRERPKNELKKNNDCRIMKYKKREYIQNLCCLIKHLNCGFSCDDCAFVLLFSSIFKRIASRRKMKREILLET